MEITRLWWPNEEVLWGRGLGGSRFIDQQKSHFAKTFAEWLHLHLLFLGFKYSFRTYCSLVFFSRAPPFSHFLSYWM